jgi:transcriptional regulator with XRE-family HTH domain
MDLSDLRVVVSTRLRALAHDEGLTGTELGKRVGASQPVVSRWLAGKRLPELLSLIALADELSVSLDALCGRVREIP